MQADDSSFNVFYWNQSDYIMQIYKSTITYTKKGVSLNQKQLKCLFKHRSLHAHASVI